MMAAARFAKFTRTVQRRELRSPCAPKFRVTPTGQSGEAPPRINAQALMPPSTRMPEPVM